MNDRDNQLTPEQREQMEEALERARSAAGRASRVGLAGVVGLVLLSVVRRMIPRPRSLIPRLRFRPRKLAYFGVALLVAAVSLTTCSAGVDLESLTAEYGEPVPANPDAARGFLARAPDVIESAAAAGRLRFSITETEATSVLSLGLMIPELMRAAQTSSPEELQAAGDLDEMRALLRQRQESAPEPRSFRERVARTLDPRLRTSDVQVRFTGAGEVVVAGYLQAWRWQQPALVVFAPRAETGQLELDFVRGQLGWLPAPAPVFDLFGQMVSSLILQGREYAEISELSVVEDRLTIEASIRS